MYGDDAIPCMDGINEMSGDDVIPSLHENDVISCVVMQRSMMTSLL
jgi:hypothetical protein